MEEYNSNDQYVAVVGAANIDIGGTPYKPLIPADSNPGEISINYGGVGRNIAHNLAKLGVPVKFITAIGGDVLGADMLSHCDSIGIDVSNALHIPDRTSSMYLYINNTAGDMEMAIDRGGGRGRQHIRGRFYACQVALQGSALRGSRFDGACRKNNAGS